MCWNILLPPGICLRSVDDWKLNTVNTSITNIEVPWSSILSCYGTFIAERAILYHSFLEIKPGWTFTMNIFEKKDALQMGTNCSSTKKVISLKWWLIMLLNIPVRPCHDYISSSSFVNFVFPKYGIALENSFLSGCMHLIFLLFLWLFIIIGINVVPNILFPVALCSLWKILWNAMFLQKNRIFIQ